MFSSRALRFIASIAHCVSLRSLRCVSCVSSVSLRMYISFSHSYLYSICSHVYKDDKKIIENILIKSKILIVEYIVHGSGIQICLPCRLHPTYLSKLSGQHCTVFISRENYPITNINQWNKTINNILIEVISYNKLKKRCTNHITRYRTLS